jgi:hypothetical protein
LFPLEGEAFVAAADGSRMGGDQQVDSGRRSSKGQRDRQPQVGPGLELRNYAASAKLGATRNLSLKFSLGRGTKQASQARQQADRGGSRTKPWLSVSLVDGGEAASGSTSSSSEGGKKSLDDDMRTVTVM